MKEVLIHRGHIVQVYEMPYGTSMKYEPEYGRKYVMNT